MYPINPSNSCRDRPIKKRQPNGGAKGKVRVSSKSLGHSSGDHKHFTVQHFMVNK